MFRITSIAILVFTGLTVQAQNHVDALRYSQESLWGSARYVSMGGAFGALGIPSPLTVLITIPIFTI